MGLRKIWTLGDCSRIAFRLSSWPAWLSTDILLVFLCGRYVERLIATVVVRLYDCKMLEWTIRYGNKPKTRRVAMEATKSESFYLNNRETFPTRSTVYRPVTSRPILIDQGTEKRLTEQRTIGAL
jgi:hypothetical protein